MWNFIILHKHLLFILHLRIPLYPPEVWNNGVMVPSLVGARAHEPHRPLHAPFRALHSLLQGVREEARIEITRGHPCLECWSLISGPDGARASLSSNTSRPGRRRPSKAQHVGDPVVHRDSAAVRRSVPGISVPRDPEPLLARDGPPGVHLRLRRPLLRLRRGRTHGVLEHDYQVI